MDASVANLLEYSRDPLVAFHEFLLDYCKDDPRLFCFFEGNDDTHYYRPRIEHDYLGYVCYGKRNVIIVHNKIAAQYAAARTAFFIDRDYDEPLNMPSIFETPGYSVENMYTEGSCFIRLLIERFEIGRRDPDFEISTNHFQRLQTEFHAKTRLLNAWLHYQARHNESRLNINDNKPLRAVFGNLIDDTLVMKPLEEIDSIEKLQAFFALATPVSVEDLNRHHQNHTQGRPAMSNRGKFELIFFKEFMLKFQKLIRSDQKTILSKRYQASPTISESASELMKTLSPLATNIIGLHAYIEERCPAM